jgi:hypothetical protein
VARVVVLAAVLALAAPSVAGDLDDFARCLGHAGATYYGASWCPHCAEQNALFGTALRWVRYVDCSDGCPGVGSYPTWRFADGSRISGVASLAALASRTGCALGGRPQARPTRADPRDSWSGVPTRQRDVGGARIIEVR